MNVLVANDDGIDARGIHELAKALHQEAGASVFVFAPDSQKSGFGHSISLRSHVEIREVPFENAEIAFAVTGTPADCVAVGVAVLRNRGIDIDMVFSGINHGSNVGTDTIYSGTVGSAMEGTIQNIPSVAVSVDSHEAEYFEYACMLAIDTIRKTGGKWDSSVMLNINTPNLPAEEIKGVRYTVIGDREYTNDIQLEAKEDGVERYVYGGEAVYYEGKPKNWDVIALQDGYASISPLHRDLTNHGFSQQLEEWRIGK